MHNLTVVYVLLVDAVLQPDPRGFDQFDFKTRLHLNGLAFLAFARSYFCLRLMLYWILWLLSGYHLVWHFDIYGTLVLAPVMSGLVWICPWLLVERKRLLCGLLGPMWG